MTPMTPAEIETITKTIEIAAKDPTWCEAIVIVINSQTSATIVQAAKSVAMSVETFIAQFGVALSEPSKILRPILQNTHLTEGQATQYLYDAQRLVNNGVPEALRAGAAGAGGAGAAGAAATAGKGAIILKGLAILGGLIAFAVVSYYVAGAFGEWSADKPIKPTWLGDPEERAAYQAEKSTHAVIYGDMIAITHGYNEYIDVTDNSLGELRYLYPPTDSLDEELQEYYYSTDRYVLYTVPVLHICTGSLFSRADTGFDNPGSRPRPNDPVTLTNMPHIDIPTIGKYKTYGEVCNAIAKIENYPKEKEFSYCYKLDCFGGCHTVVFCKRERL